MSDNNAAENLRRAVRFWRILAIVSWVVLALGALGATLVIGTQKDLALRAAQAEAEARDQAVKAREDESRAKQQAQQMLYASSIALAQKEMEQGENKLPKKD